jgi:hypothetical protein
MDFYGHLIAFCKLNVVNSPAICESVQLNRRRSTPWAQTVVDNLYGTAPVHELLKHTDFTAIR